MSRLQTVGYGEATRFPRSRGDEPLLWDVRELADKFSPLTRG